ncbi:hypothetical protein BDFB_013442, partial [Asbolus verrucosus]
MDKINSAPRQCSCAKNAWFYLGRVRKSTSDEVIKNYIVQKIPGSVKDLTVDKLSNNGTYDSFKIGILFDCKDNLSNEEFWPKCVLLRRFNFPNRVPDVTNKSRGGGVLAAIKRDIPCYQFNINVNKREELWIHITLNDIKIILGVVYFPPNFNLDIYIQHVNLVNNLVSDDPNSLKFELLLLWKSSVDCDNFIPFNISSMPEEYLCDNFAFNGLLQFNNIQENITDQVYFDFKMAPYD